MPFATSLSEVTLPAVKNCASTILATLQEAQSNLIGKAVVLTDGKAGTVDNVWLDEFHGLRISVCGHDGRWPISTIKFIQSDPPPVETGNASPPAFAFGPGSFRPHPR
jgi:hypothetical protein